MTLRSSGTARAYREAGHPGSLPKLAGILANPCRLRNMRAWPLVVALAAACGNSSMNTADGPGSSGGSDGGTDAAIPPGWEMLISRPWSLDAPGADVSRCARIKVDHDM